MTWRIVVVAAAFSVGVGAGAIAAAIWLSSKSGESAGGGVAERQTTRSSAQRLTIDLDPRAFEGEDTLANILLLPSDFQQTLTLYALLADADRATLERLLDEAEHLRPRHEGRAAKSIIYSRYAELDPHAAVERIIAGGMAERDLLPQVFRAWAKHDLMAALRRAKTLPPLYRRAAGAALLAVSENALPGLQSEIAATFGLHGQLEQMQADEAMRTSPALAWQQALAAPPSPHRESVLHRIAYSWAERDPEQALAAIGELAQPDMRHSMQRQLMTFWAMSDRHAARAWVEAQPPSKERTAMSSGFAAGLAQDAPVDALDFALTLAAYERRDAAYAVFGVWARQDPRAAAETLAALDDAVLARQSATVVMQAWADADPYAAFEWMSTQEALMQDGALYAAPLYAIAKRQPVQAFELALELPEGQGRTHALASVFRTWAQNDPRAAAAAWQKQQPSMQFDPSIVSSIAHQYAKLDMEEAWDWLQAQPKTQQQMALHAIVPEFVQEAESLAEVGRLVDRINDADIRNEAVYLAASAWAQQDPKEAIRWVGRIAKGADLARLQSGLFETWADIDRGEAVAHARRLRKPAERDAAYLGLAMAALRDFDANFAEDMHNRIRNKAMRQEVAQSFYWFWQQHDPERAARYREEAGIVDSN